MSAKYQNLNAHLGSFAALELHNVTERIEFLVAQLQDSRQPDELDDVRCLLLERELLVIVGKGTGLLKVLQHNLDMIHTGLYLTEEGEERWPRDQAA